MKKEMQEELSRIPTMPEASAHAYHEHLSFLLDRVNKKLASREDLSSLIGSNPANAMFDNHRNHAVFTECEFGDCLVVRSLILHRPAGCRTGFLL